MIKYGTFAGKAANGSKAALIGKGAGSINPYGLAATVNSSISSLTGNFYTAVRPQIVKYYSQRNYSVTPNFHITGFATYTDEKQFDAQYFDERTTTDLSSMKDISKILKDWTIIHDNLCLDTEKQIFKIAKKSSYFKK